MNLRVRMVQLFSAILTESVSLLDPGLHDPQRPSKRETHCKRAERYGARRRFLVSSLFRFSHAKCIRLKTLQHVVITLHAIRPTRILRILAD